MAVANIPTANRYESLSNEEMEAEEGGSSQDTHPPAKMQKNNREERVKSRMAQVDKVRPKRKDAQNDESEIESEMEGSAGGDTSSSETLATTSESEEEGELVQQKKEEKPRKKLTDSPIIYVDDMPPPKFKEYLKKKEIAAETRILNNGKQSIDCEYKDRPVLLKWLAKHATGGPRTPVRRIDRQQLWSRESTALT